MDIKFIEMGDIDYRKEKVKAYLHAIKSEEKNNESAINYIVATIYESPMDFKLANEIEEMNKLSDEDYFEFQEFICKTKRLITKTFPLVKCERIRNDKVSYLIEDYFTYPTGTLVFLRTTNKAKVVCIFPNFRYSNGKIIVVNTQQMSASLPATPEIPQVVKDLFGSMVSGLLGMAGSWVFDQAFPKGVKDLDDLFAKIQESTRNIFKEELDKETIDKKENSIKSMIRFMQEEYNPRKRDPNVTKNELYNMLRVKDDRMWDDVMADLVSERYRSKGITHLVSGANTHLSILQELAAIDPIQPDPQKSSFMITFYARLEAYLDALDKAVNEVYEKRITYLSPVKIDTPWWSTRLRWVFQDFWVDKTYEFWDHDFDPHGYDRCVEGRKQYSENTFIPKIVNDLVPYNKTKTDWIAMRKK